MAKGGGSANKRFLFQETKAVLNPTRMLRVPRREDPLARHRRLPAVPPRRRHRRHLGRVRAEDREVASAHYLDNLPTEGSMAATAFRDLELEEEVLRAHPVVRHRRAVRRQVLLPRRARRSGCRATAPRCPVGDRGLAARPTARRSARSPATASSSSSSRPTRRSTCPTPTADDISAARSCTIDLNRPMAEILAELSKYPVKTRLSLTGPMVVARDIAHAKIKERLDAGEGMPAVPARTTRSTTPARPRRPTGYGVRLVRADHRRAGWTPTSSSSRPPAARW